MYTNRIPNPGAIPFYVVLNCAFKVQNSLPIRKHKLLKKTPQLAKLFAKRLCKSKKIAHTVSYDHTDMFKTAYHNKLTSQDTDVYTA